MGGALWMRAKQLVLQKPSVALTSCEPSSPQTLGKKDSINIKNSGGTPPGVCVCVCPICPMDMFPSVPSSVPSVPLTFSPLNWNFHINRPQLPGCPWGVLTSSLGHSRGIPTTKFLYVIFFTGFFLHKHHRKKGQRCNRFL